MTIYLLDKGIGVTDGLAIENEGALEINLKGSRVDCLYVGSKLIHVVDGVATVPTKGLCGVVSVVARNSITGSLYTCEDLFVDDGVIIPLARVSPAEYVAMADEAREVVKSMLHRLASLETAVYGLDIFNTEGKDD